MPETLLLRTSSSVVHHFRSSNQDKLFNFSLRTSWAWSGLRGVWAPKDAVIDWEKIRPSGFHVLPHRWIVERTFAWLSTWRRLSKDYEVLPSSEDAWIHVAMIRLMLRRFVQNGS